MANLRRERATALPLTARQSRSTAETPRFQCHEQENENERLDPGADDEPLRPHAIRHPRQSNGE